MNENEKEPGIGTATPPTSENGAVAVLPEAAPVEGAGSELQPPSKVAKAEVLAETYGLSEAQYSILLKTVCKEAPREMAGFFLAFCHNRKLDPFAKHVYLWKQSENGKESWQIVSGIDGLRTIASRNPDYRGQSKPEWEFARDKDGEIIRFAAEESQYRNIAGKRRPEQCEVIAYRAIRGASLDRDPIPYYGIARFDEFVKSRTDNNRRKIKGNWEHQPEHQLRIRAEAMALRLAFPEDVGGIYTEDEFQDRMIDVTPAMEQAQKDAAAETTTASGTGKGASVSARINAKTVADPVPPAAPENAATETIEGVVVEDRTPPASEVKNEEEAPPETPTPAATEPPKEEKKAPPPTPVAAAAPAGGKPIDESTLKAVKGILNDSEVLVLLDMAKKRGFTHESFVAFVKEKTNFARLRTDTFKVVQDLIAELPVAAKLSGVPEPLDEQVYLVVDTETIGLVDDPANDRVVEVGAAWCDLFGRVGNVFGSYVDPGCAIPPEASGIHHITARDVDGAPEIEVVIADIRSRFPGCDLLVAHNVEFDEPRLPKLDYGADGNMIPAIPWLCTKRLAMHLFPDRKDHRNQTMRYFFGGVDIPGVEPGTAHRALADARVTAFVLGNLIRVYLERGNPDDLGSLVTFAAGPIRMQVLKFGSAHYGKPISEVPTDYFEWMLGPKGPADRLKRDPDLLFTIRAELAERRGELLAF